MIRIQVLGLKELIEKTKSENVEKGLNDAMRIVMNDAKEMAVHNASIKTGKLRKSIFMKKVGSMLYNMGAKVPYAVYQEFGTKFINIGTVENPRYIRSGYHPFIRPAVLFHIRKFPNLFKQKYWIKK